MGLRCGLKAERGHHTRAMGTTRTVNVNQTINPLPQSGRNLRQIDLGTHEPPTVSDHDESATKLHIHTHSLASCLSLPNNPRPPAFTAPVSFSIVVYPLSACYSAPRRRPRV